jgi:hypothetical protein
MAGEPFRMPGGFVVPVLAVVSLGAILVKTVTAKEFLAVGIVVAASVVMYGVRSLRSGVR